MASTSVAEKIKAVEAKIAEAEQDLANTVDPTGRAGINQKLGGLYQLLASYQTGNQMTSSDIAMLKESIRETVSSAVKENIAPISKLVAGYQLRVFVPVASYASSHQERNRELKNSAIVVYGVCQGAPSGKLRCQLLNTFINKRSGICSHVFRLDWVTEKACVGLDNLDVVENVFFLNRFAEMALDRFWLIFVAVPELQHASFPAGAGHTNTSSSASTNTTHVTTKYTAGCTLVAHWLGDPKFRPGVDDWPFHHGGCTDDQWSDIKSVFGKRTIEDTMDRKPVTWAEGNDNRTLYRCFMAQASHAIRYGLEHGRITPQWLIDRGLSKELILNFGQNVSPEGSVLVQRYMNDLDTRLQYQPIQPAHSMASVPEDNATD